MEFYNVTSYATIETYKYMTAPWREILFLSVSLLFIVALKSIVNQIHSKLPFRAILMTSGATMGYVARENEALSKYLNLSVWNPNLFIIIFFPIFIFNNAFKINQAVFTKNKWQALILAFVGVILNTATVASILKITFFKDWYWITLLIYSVICSPIDAQEIIQQFHDSPIVQYFQVLLEGESLFGEVLSIYILKFLLHQQVECVNTHEGFNLGLQWIVGGAIFGYVIGGITAIITVHASHSSTCNTVIISSLYLTVFTSTHYLNISGDIAVAALSVVVAKNQYRMKKKVKHETAQFWNVLGFIGSSVMLFVASCIIGQYIMHFVQVFDAFKVILTIMIIPFIRFLTVLILYYLLRRMNGGFTMRQAIVTILSFGRSSLSVAMSIILIKYGTKDEKSYIINVHMFWTTLITLVIIGGISSYILYRLQLKEPPLSNKNHLTNCIKRLEKSRDKAIGSLKMSPHMTDVNWSVLEESKIFF